MKAFLFCTLFFLALCTIPAMAQTSLAGNDVRSTVVSNGIGLGGAIAVVASWSRNKSVLWAILHGILGWLYVIYFVVTRTSTDR